MLLTIDPAKVNDLLKAREPQYLVTTSNLATSEPPKVQLPSAAVFGAYFKTQSVVETERYITSLRNRVVASGLSLKTAAEIDLELDHMRRRG